MSQMQNMTAIERLEKVREARRCYERAQTLLRGLGFPHATEMVRPPEFLFRDCEEQIYVEIGREVVEQHFTTG